jgi:hypothetical protein
LPLTVQNGNLIAACNIASHLCLTPARLDSVNHIHFTLRHHQPIKKMETDTGEVKYLLQDNKLRDGRHGPVFLAMNASTGKLLAAERLDLEEPILPSALGRLEE